MSYVRNRRFSKTIRPIVTKNMVNAKIIQEEPSSISPNHGVPPPIDQKPSIRFEDTSSESNSYTDIEIMSMKTANQYLSTQIKSKISEYKKNNQVHISKQHKILGEVNSVHNEIGLIKGSLEDILIETHKTKEELREMREIIEGNSFEECNEISEKKIFSETIFDDIKELINSVKLLNLRLNNNEEEIKNKDEENKHLKETINGLKESILEIKFLDNKKANNNCKCKIF